MSPNNSVFVDPSTLSLPSPQSDAPDSPCPSHADDAPGPSRKRPRTDVTPEERREARAHRNRIAAQNSRDKRKMQFATLERRVAELEEENRQLRAGMDGAALQRADDRRKEELEREKARETENAELKERIKSLEKGWETVMKVLAAQGLPTPPATNNSLSLPQPSPPTSNSPTTFPVFVPASPVFPITPSPTGGDHRGNPPRGVPAAGGLNTTLQSAYASPISAPTPTEFATTTDATPAADAAVDAWIREIFSGSPVLSPSTLPDPHGEEPAIPFSAPTPAEAPLMGAMEIESDWQNELEMQRILDLLPLVQSDEVIVDDQSVDVSAALGLELCGGWNLGQDAVSMSSGVGVF
ncbi:hypothetical protein M0805_005718 [Coniferiporia weirii]|nr:hypothetical protein M0805_005718 [Coniferiporia weirii]